jgi:hypothetical protein
MRGISHTIPLGVGAAMEFTYEIKIGEDPGTFVCEWSVYIALEFNPTETLKEVRIKKEGPVFDA